MTAVVIVAMAVGAFGWLTADQWERSRPAPPATPPPPRRPPGWALGRALGDPHRRLQLNRSVGRTMRSARVYTLREAVDLVTSEAAADRVRAIHTAAARRLARPQIGTTTP